MGTLSLETPLSSIHNIGPRFLKYLHHLGLKTVRDLLWHFPFRYEDYSEIVPIANLEPGARTTVQAVIKDVAVRRTWQRHMTIVEATLEDATGAVRAVWFNQPYLKDTLRPGRLANFSGKVSVGDGSLYLSHPTYELVAKPQTIADSAQTDEEENLRESALRQRTSALEWRHTGRLVPIYPETHGLTSRGLRYLVQPLLDAIELPGEWLPEPVLRAHRLPEIREALHAIHFPHTLEEALDAKRRFAFEDLFLLQLYNLGQKEKLSAYKAPAMKISKPALAELVAHLPFPLTASQKQSLAEILDDIGTERPMNRMLQGDVGSGKTVVAALAAIVASRAEYQAAFMAPTELLAQQHYDTFRKLFGSLGTAHAPSLGLITSSGARISSAGESNGSSVSKEEFYDAVRNGNTKIVVGTHALLSSPVKFRNLGLVVIDEQHRFGVRQRAALVERKTGGTTETKTRVPHFLSMSATPIPRSLMMTLFGDLDLSLITELPTGRKSIVTKVVDPVNRMKAYAFIRAHIKKGRQAYVICPRIEQQDEANGQKSRLPYDFKTELKSVKEEFEKLSTRIFPDLRVAVLHGQLKAKEKESVMRDFSAKGGSLPDRQAGASGGKEHAIDILVSTSVVEVGVDVPNATIMMIEGSDSFGLAQLYQFRGRVGRGTHQSFCFLFTESKAKSVHERLQAVAEAKNGYELAEKDLALRGPGEFLGERQTGLPDVAMRGLQDLNLVRAAREAAEKTAALYPNLNDMPALRARLREFVASVHLE